MMKLWLIGLGLLIWLAAFVSSKWSSRRAVRFWLGSLGLMIFLTGALTGPLAQAWAQVLARVVGGVGTLSGCYTGTPGAPLLNIPGPTGLSILAVDYECTGLMESIVYLGLLWFFPLYTWRHRVKWTVIGLGWLALANVLRLTVVALLLATQGSAAFWWAHALVGRGLFYGLIIPLYYYVFTKAQLTRPGTVRFNYGGK